MNWNNLFSECNEHVLICMTYLPEGPQFKIAEGSDNENTPLRMTVSSGFGGNILCK